MWEFDETRVTKPCYVLNLILTLFKHQTKSMLFRIKFTLVLVDGSINLFNCQQCMTIYLFYSSGVCQLTGICPDN